MSTISVRNIQKNIEFVHQRTLELAQKNSREENFDNDEVQKISLFIQKVAKSIDVKTRNKKGTPADLSNQNFARYQWLRFLGQKKWLLAHISALSEFLSIGSHINRAKRIMVRPGNLEIRITHSNNLFKSKRKGNYFLIEINEGFITAPLEIKELLLKAAMGSKQKPYLEKIRNYTKTSEYKSITKNLKQVAQPNLLTTRGKVYDLKNYYEKINDQYFQGMLMQPRLVWSTRKSRRRLGMYDPDSHTITINRILDNVNVASIALEYILFHEMLHQKIGIKERNGRRYAHTPIFKKFENKFVGKEKADAAIKGLLQV